MNLFGMTGENRAATPDSIKGKKQSGDEVPQIDKFRDLAREIGADEDPEAFKAKLRKVATAPRQPKPEPKP